MKRRIIVAILVIGAVISATAAQTKPRGRYSRSVTGHYRMTKGEFRNRLDVQQLGSGKIKFYLLALWVSHNNPDNIHNGELQGSAEFHNGVATYDDGDCKITIEFLATRAIVTELLTDGCGFGANVTAAGSYRRLDNKKPKFDF